MGKLAALMLVLSVVGLAGVAQAVGMPHPPIVGPPVVPHVPVLPGPAVPPPPPPHPAPLPPPMRPRHHRHNDWDRCFIATAAYGTPWEEHVWTLRSFRDECLLSTEIGRGFVALYYATSPPLADAIRSRPWARGATRVALTPVVVLAGAMTGDLGDIGLVAACVVVLGLAAPRVRRAAKRRRG